MQSIFIAKISDITTLLIILSFYYFVAFLVTVHCSMYGMQCRWRRNRVSEMPVV